MKYKEYKIDDRKLRILVLCLIVTSPWLVAFFGIGLPELFLLITVFLLAYGMIMLGDSIRRPHKLYKYGKKTTWISILVVFNLIYLFSLFLLQAPLPMKYLFVSPALVYHLTNRWGNRIPKKKKV